MSTTDIKVTPVDGGKRIKATATVRLDGGDTIGGIKIVRMKAEYFVVIPARKYGGPYDHGAPSGQTDTDGDQGRGAERIHHFNGIIGRAGVSGMKKAVKTKNNDEAKKVRQWVLLDITIALDIGLVRLWLWLNTFPQLAGNLT